ncbi:hypothetical protein GGR53DRAFT_122039 [Hypoxylon sp. FL1150]|nr:hypothetical protein GGR53DRAFT_122039 [Hypoxylon sp. FL1150]
MGCLSDTNFAALLSDKKLFDALPCLALPCLALPCLALPCLALPCLALPCLALPCQPTWKRTDENFFLLLLLLLLLLYLGGNAIISERCHNTGSLVIAQHVLD